MELDKRLDEERHRYQTCDAKMEELGPEGGEGQAGLLKRRIFEIEEELSMAKEVSVKLHEQMEMTAERAVSYEHELERVSGLLVEAEAEKLALRAEMEKIREEQVGFHCFQFFLQSDYYYSYLIFLLLAIAIIILALLYYYAHLLLALLYWFKRQ